MRRAVILVRIDDEHGTTGTLSTTFELPDDSLQPRDADDALRCIVDEALSTYPALDTWTVTR